MATKKESREQAERSALLQRIEDIWTGANGGCPPSGDDFANASLLATFVVGCQRTFDPKKQERWAWEIHNLNHYDTPQSTADFLYERGVRADLSHLKRWERDRTEAA